ncbi:stage II sporulation protein D [Paenibacillus rhizosphaerae]|uniref:Stage II sporulation protein D n=1 Tax=Paenibacillus rhizosphaerae TaxID=297318 RepID=A0A839TP01_9BACL|nr:SpoIID/LytB domain-containing protein [Paenibacillus rhizosphaerae]MBB3127089.1 stage II sporulation protein D [Paenibacillus rhizosphaerae]
MGNWWRTKAVQWGSKGILAAVLATGVLQLPAVTADAAGTSPDQIRVGLFLDLGSTYKSTTPVVTLSSGQSWSAGVSAASSGAPALVSFGANETAKFSVDGFRVKVLATSDAKTAADAYKKLNATADKPVIYAASTGAGTVYQVYTGMYASQQAANDAAARTAKTAAGQLNGQIPIVTGGNHLSAGTYASEAEAAAAAQQIQASGADAFVAVQPGGDGGSYAVWVGEAADASGLAAVRSAVSAKLPAVTLSEVDASQPVLILRSDAGSSPGSSAAVKHIVVSGTDAKGWITSSGDQIKVAERSGRTYRGGMEISMVNGQLALVNVLPFEQYLYAVVGGEVPASWPEESLKAQAVAARSYAAFQIGSSNKFKVADVVDTTLSQAYNGVASEAPSVINAVDATQGEVLMQNGKVVEAVFSSNAGGASADPTEVWNSGGDAFGTVDSKEDVAAQNGAKTWYHVLLSNGITGYVREDNVKELGTATAAGLAKVTVTAKSTNVRPLPLIQSNVEPAAQMNPGDTAVVLEQVKESGTYDWVRGPYTSAELVKTLKGKTSTAAPSTISTLEVTKRGPSGRAVQIKANGQILDVNYPDMFRSALNGLPSTLFDIVPTGSYTVLSANGTTAKVSGTSDTSVISASGTTSIAGKGTIVMNGDSKARRIEAGEAFLFVGRGNGHGLGLSQWGAKGMADAGYGYQDILKHYYQNVTIVKE